MGITNSSENVAESCDAPGLLSTNKTRTGPLTKNKDFRSLTEPTFSSKRDLSLEVSNVNVKVKLSLCLPNYTV
jgi:hypothetical protein